MVRAILTYPDPFLTTRAAAVPRVDDRIRDLVRDMFETMRAAKGVGLAAPQVGVSRRVIVVDVSPAVEGEAPLALVNPEIVERRGAEPGVEGCLSVPGVEGEVVRSAFVAVRGLDERGDPVRVEATGLLARALQHEIDHLDGVLFITRLSAAASAGR